VGESLPVRQQPLARQAARDLTDLAFAGAGLEGKAAARRGDGLEHLHSTCPQALRLAIALGSCLFFTALPLPLALGLDPATLFLQQARALCGDLRRPGRTAALNPDQAAIVQGARRDTE
jgi:hypothetical protein